MYIYDKNILVKQNFTSLIKSTSYCIILRVLNFTELFRNSQW